MSNLYEKFHNENVSTKEYDEGTDNNVTRERVRAVEEAHIIMCSAGDLFTAELPQPGEAAPHWHCHSGSEDNLRHLRGEADLG